VAQRLTPAPEIVECPGTLSVGALMFAMPVPILKPPPLGVTLAVVWQPELPQSAPELPAPGPVWKWPRAVAEAQLTIEIVFDGGGPANGPVFGP
jgi:hypothetical protein